VQKGELRHAIRVRCGISSRVRIILLYGLYFSVPRHFMSEVAVPG
jgi:hypothetical protein